MGVLTHLDKFRNNKTLKTTKKRLKNRFWTEIYQGAKLFYLSGIINGKYPNMEIQNLSRFISVMKFRPLIWRNTHPYVVADRIEDLTDPELLHRKPNCDRTVTLYGYLRGTNLKPNMRVHIPGAGDHYLADVSVLPDPCPLPDKERKRLDEKNKLIYAPMSDVGGVMYDKDAVYINVPGHFTKKSAYAPVDLQQDGQEQPAEEEEEEVIPHGTGEKLVMNLQDAQDTLASQLEDSELRIFSGSAPVKAADVKESLEQDESGRTRRRAVFGNEDEGEDEDMEDDDEDDEDDLMDVGEDDDDEEDAPRRGKALSKFDTRNIPKKGEKDAKEENDNEADFEFADSDSDLGEDDDQEEMVLVDGRRKRDSDDEELAGELRWKANLQEKASNMFSNHRRTNLMTLIYNNPDLTPEDILNGNYGDDADTNAENEVEDAEDEEFFKLNRENANNAVVIDSSRDPIDMEELEEWDDEDTLDSIRNRFITGDINATTESAFPPEEDEVEGDFEDLEAEEDEGANDEETGKKSKRDKEAMIPDPMRVERERLAKRKEELRKKFTEEFGDDDEGPKMDFYEQKKSEIEQQLQTNRAEFEHDDPHTRAMVEGYRPGSYVRLLIKDMPCEFVENFDPTYPVLVGGLLTTENQFGWVQVRIKRHRWHPKILKTNDPLIFSMGWRRFQSIPIYSLNDGTRNRMLKYTPEHMHCLATFYGPVHTPNTGFCAVQNVTDNRAVSLCLVSFVCFYSSYLYSSLSVSAQLVLL
jgi:ribosome biogenesis protein BMS1